MRSGFLKKSLIVFLGAGFAAIVPALGQEGLRSVTIDASARVGVIKPLTGFNGAAMRAGTTVDNSLVLRQVGVTMSRTHDTGGGDIMSSTAASPNVIFPDKNADPNNPASYSFGRTDTIVAGLKANGIEPYFRVGDGHDGFVPPDLDKYAEVVRHIVMHYNKGWNNGYRMGIRYWEFWNEPDLNFPGRAQYWAGDSKLFFEFYSKVAQAIKQADSTALVGGPTTGGNNADYHVPFLRYVRDNHLPLDFYAYHWYTMGSNDPYDFVRITDQIRGELKTFGFGEIPITITEWGYDLYNRTTGPERPVFLSSSLSYMQDTSITYSLYHSAGAGPLFNADGLTPTGLAFQAHASLQATPERLRVEGGDTNGFTVIAGRATPASSDTDKEIRILVTNYEIPPDNRGPHTNGKGMPSAAPYEGGDVLVYPACVCTFWTLSRRNPVYSNNSGYNLTIRNLPAWAAEGVTVSRYRLDATHKMTLVDSLKGRGPSIQLTQNLPSPAVELIIIRADSAGPAKLEGTWRAPIEVSGVARAAGQNR